MSNETSGGSGEDPGSPGDPSSDLPAGAGGIAGEVSRRVSSILDAVEEEAARLREEARREAALYLEEARRQGDEALAERQRRIGELSDELIAKTEAVVARLDDAEPVRQSFENLVRALGDAAERLSREAEHGRDRFQPPPFGTQPPRAAVQPPPSTSPPPAAAQPAPIPAPPPAAQPQPAPVPAPPPDSIHTIAIQMATSGWTRREVGDHLQRTLGFSDPEPVLDEVFGAGSADDARVPWTAYPR